MSITQQQEVMLRPEQLLALENMKNYGVPEEIIDKTRQDFEKANFELLAVTKRKRGNEPVIKKIDSAIYVRTMLPAIGERQDLGRSLELLVAFALVIDAEIVDKAKKLIELDELDKYNAMDCVRGINAVVDRKRGWLDRDTQGKLSELIQTLQPEEEVEFEVEDEEATEDESDTSVSLPLAEDEEEAVATETPEAEDVVTVPTTTGRRKKQEAASETEAA